MKNISYFFIKSQDSFIEFIQYTGSAFIALFIPIFLILMFPKKDERISITRIFHNRIFKAYINKQNYLIHQEKTQ
jgi:hypothetical protein